MLNQRQKLATSYTSLGGYSFRAGPAQASSPGPPSLREVDGLLGPRRAQEKWKMGGSKRARRAYNLPPIPARMSARSRANKVETYPVG